MSAYGCTQGQIAAVIGISDVTLRLHYRHELDTGAIEANAAVAQSLFHRATKCGNVTAAIFWLKTRAGWRETVHIANAANERPFVVSVKWADATPPEPEPPPDAGRAHRSLRTGPDQVRAERRCGQLLRDREMAKRGPAAETGQGSQRATSDAIPLAALGISKTQSSRWQKLAALPDPDFEATFAGRDALAGC